MTLEQLQAIIPGATADTWHRHNNPGGELGGWVSNTALVAASVRIDPTTIVCDEVVIGKGAYIGKGVYISAGAYICRGAYIDEGAQIGEDAAIGEGVVIGYSTVIGDRAKIWAAPREHPANIVETSQNPMVWET